MSKILQTRAAARDIDGIWDYIAIEHDNPDAANRLIDQFAVTFQQLATNPGIGRHLDQLKQGLRQFPVRRNYVIFYESRDDQIVVIRVLHASRNITRQLFELDE